jgi:arginine utilization protein RocB
LSTEDIQELSIPAVNLGVLGKGAHTWKERIHKPYSYEVLPQLIREVISNLSREEKDRADSDKRLSGTVGKL